MTQPIQEVRFSRHGADRVEERISRMNRWTLLSALKNQEGRCLKKAGTDKWLFYTEIQNRIYAVIFVTKEIERKVGAKVVTILNTENEQELWERTVLPQEDWFDPWTGIMYDEPWKWNGPVMEGDGK